MMMNMMRVYLVMLTMVVGNLKVTVVCNPKQSIILFILFIYATLLTFCKWENSYKDVLLMHQHS